jgi:hypothetical protein
VRLPPVCHPLLDAIRAHLPALGSTQQEGLAWWVYGVSEAKTGCESRVVAALEDFAPFDTIRQHLREWLRDGSDKVAPCATQVDVSACFAPLLRWLLSGWEGRELVLAIDPTTHGDDLTVLVISVLYRSCALPVAWHVLPGNQKGEWIAPLLTLLQTLQPAVPRRLRVLVLADRGLWSPRLFRQLKALGWHPLLRVQRDLRVWLRHGRQCAAHQLVPQVGHAWVGRAIVHTERARRLWVTVVVLWEAHHEEPWVLLTDLPPKVVGVRWYGLRMWIECGFRTLKHYGWDWAHTRRREPTRVARHWLVLAVASLWVLAAGTAVEDAGRSCPGPPPARTGRRPLSVFQHGLARLRAVFAQRCAWPPLRFVPERLPVPGPHITITYHTPGPPRDSPYLPL